MKMKSFFKIAFMTSFLVVFSSCFKDLDTVPTDKDELTSAAVYDDPANYKKVLARLYAGLAVTGQQGPAGQGDISGIDEGFGQYLRMYWYLQELSTDEAVIGWNDATIKDFHEQDWSADDGFVYACYSRIFYQVSICNEFLRETTDAKLSDRGVNDAVRAEVQGYRAEARFLRALSYYHALDLFRNVPFVTEEDPVGAFFPEQIQGDALYAWLETELKAVETELPAPRSNEYGRADQAAAWMLLAKLYLNAEIYAGKQAFGDAATYSKKVMDAGYELEANYFDNFVADNDKSSEVIFTINFDGTNTRTYGGMTFLIHAPVGGSMSPEAFGIDGGWGGLRTTSAAVAKFPPPPTSGSIIVPKNEGNQTYDLLNVPGTYQGWDVANDATALSSVANDDRYEGYFWFEAGTKYKFAKGDWAFNWGDTGADGILEPGGDDISIAETGFYRLNVDLTTLTYTVVKTDWGLIGDATPGQWADDTNMSYDAVENAWTITADLVAGKAKFRANDGWDINLGDNAADGILEYGGSDITIPGNGTYLIKLYLDRPDYAYSIEKFSSESDTRWPFYTDGQNLEIADISQFTEGYAVGKFKNVNADGSAAKDKTFVDTDFPMFRLTDAHLMYAEAVLRRDGSADQTALDAVNAVRQRAYNGSTLGNITASELTLDFILDERVRELLWEGHRRTDLVRFGQFTDGSYLWPWKGGVANGTVVDGCRDIYPIPSQDLNANPSLNQNDCY